MPDEAAPLRFVLDAGEDFFDGAHLVLAEDDFGEHVVFGEEEDVFAQEPQEGERIEEAGDFGLEVARLDVFPVDEVFAAGGPGGAVIEIEHLGDFEDLGGGEELGRFVVIAADLLDGFGGAVRAGGVLGLADGDGDAVDEEDDIGAVAEDGALLRPFVRDLEDVALRVLEVYEGDVALAALGGDKDALLAAEPGEGVAVAFDGGVEEVEAAQDVIGTGIVHDAGVEGEELGAEDFGEVEAALAATEALGFLVGDAPPAGSLGIFEQRILDGAALAHVAAPSVMRGGLPAWDGGRPPDAPTMLAVGSSAKGRAERRPVMSSSSRARKSSSWRAISPSRAAICSSHACAALTTSCCSVRDGSGMRRSATRRELMLCNPLLVLARPSS